jgi:hypothetical protein
MQPIMRRFAPAFIALLSLLAGGGVLVRDAGAADPLQVDPGHHRTEFENPYFRVDRGFFGPGESSPDFFDAEGVVIVALTPMRMRLHLPDGKFVDAPPAPAGAVVWAPPGRIRPENLLDQRIEFVIVFPRGSTGKSRRIGADAVAADPDQWKIEVENETVRALRFQGAPHAKGNTHGHPDHIVVFLTNAKTLVHLPDGRSQYSVRSRGEVVNVPAGEHAPENLLDEPVEVIVVERK